MSKLDNPHVGVSKNRGGKPPKMDGENNGKPYWNGWFGEFSPYIWRATHVPFKGSLSKPYSSYFWRVGLPYCSPWSSGFTKRLWAFHAFGEAAAFAIQRLALWGTRHPGKASVGKCNFESDMQLRASVSSRVYLLGWVLHVFQLQFVVQSTISTRESGFVQITKLNIQQKVQFKRL